MSSFSSSKLVASKNIIVKGSSRDTRGVANNKRSLGSGGEFQHISEYIYGEPFRNIDSAASARTGRYQVKRYYNDAGKSSLIILDPTHSMHFGSSVSKWRTALEVCEVIFLALTRDGDKVRIVAPGVLDSGYIGAESFLESVHKLKSSIGKDVNQYSSFLKGDLNIARYSSIVLITDIFSFNNEQIVFSQRCSEYNSLTVIRIVDSVETSIPITKSALTFIDQENGKTVRTVVDHDFKLKYDAYVLNFMKTSEKVLNNLSADVINITNGPEYLSDIVGKLSSRSSYARS